MTENQNDVEEVLTAEQQISAQFKKIKQDWLGLMALSVIIFPFVFLATDRPLNEYPNETQLGLFITVVLSVVIMFSYLVYVTVGGVKALRQIYKLYQK